MDVSLVIDNRESEGLGPSHEAKIGFGAPFLFFFFSWLPSPWVAIALSL